MKSRVAALAVATAAVVAACGSPGSPTGAPAASGVDSTAPAVPTAPPTTPLPATPPTQAGVPPTSTSASALDTPAPSWRVPPGTPVDQSRVAALEAALGGPIVVATDAIHPWTFTGPGRPFDADAVWRATGVDPKTVQVTTAGATTTAQPKLGDVTSPLATVVVTGDGGRVISARG